MRQIKELKKLIGEFSDICLKHGIFLEKKDINGTKKYTKKRITVHRKIINILAQIEDNLKIYHYEEEE